jgi:hypothetical protein
MFNASSPPTRFVLSSIQTCASTNRTSSRGMADTSVFDMFILRTQA